MRLFKKLHKVGWGNGFDYLKWSMLPFWLSALSAVIFLPVFHYVENSNERHRLDAELSLQQQEWDKQEKILQTLRQKSDSRQLSPELANSVLPINQHVQSLLNGRLRALDLRWDFSQHTLLHLSLQGYFVDLQQFFDRTFKRCSYTFFNSIKH